ncbi:peptidase domain-containing ABC transporter [Priestia megaterium]|uniref:peptidase domain-containing ABC transporter n=1 Tax=Priestia megaterium TaxID=1404 RepID=UPI000CA12ED7|nr:peptidase domain-containing ABC transporter [Priestia megaterium]AUO14639.1 peptidase domain-containing ABC transporter [Priestia megaterium]
MNTLRKLKHIEQGEHSECGLACIAMVLQYYKIEGKLSGLRNKYGVPKGGFTLLHLSKIAQDYGLHSKGMKVSSFESLKQVSFPLIAFWKKKHFVVIAKIRKDKALILDPASGKLWLPLNECIQYFSGFILTFDLNQSEIKTKTHKGKEKNYAINILLNKKGTILTLLFVALLTQIIGALIPMTNQWLVDQLSTATQQKYYTFIGISIGVCLVLFYLLQLLRGRLITYFQTYFDDAIMSRFIYNLINLPITFFMNRSTGDLIFRSNLNVYIRQILTQRLVTIITDCLFLFVYLFIMIQYSVQLTIITVVFACIIVIVSILNAKKVKEVTDSELIEQSKVQKIVTEMVEGIETIKSIHVGNQFYDKWKIHFNKQLELTQKKNMIMVFLGNIPVSLQFILPITLVWVGIYYVNINQLTLGELLGINTIALSFITPVVSLANSYTELVLLSSYFSKLEEVTDTKGNEPMSNLIENTSINSIGLQGVEYKYSTFEAPIVKNINLKILKGQKVAIVGKSGSGKSTLLKLLSGLLEPTNGQLTINSKDAACYSNSFYEQKIGVVNQHPYIFNMSVKDNIVLNNYQEPKDNARLEQAIIYSDILDIVQGLPLGLLTQVSEGGENFSGGQRQKISIARAIYKNPELLIMDEPTSSLDNISEEKIMNYLIRNDQTLIVAAHRLNTICNFDRIIVMNEGEIVEEGTHYELINQKGYYYNIYSTEEAKEFI